MKKLLALVLRNLAGETAITLERETGTYHAQIHKLTKQYLEGGEKALINKRKGSRYIGICPKTKKSRNRRLRT